MDMWSDPNKTPFMAVTAHWIEGTTQETSHGPQHILKLRANLIGFHRIPGHHDGEHLAHSFLHILDRISITWKVCHGLICFIIFVCLTAWIDWLGYSQQCLQQ
jgi:hypothetical protein